MTWQRCRNLEDIRNGSRGKVCLGIRSFLQCALYRVSRVRSATKCFIYKYGIVCHPQGTRQRTPPCSQSIHSYAFLPYVLNSVNTDIDAPLFSTPPITHKENRREQPSWARGGRRIIAPHCICYSLFIRGPRSHARCSPRNLCSDQVLFCCGPAYTKNVSCPYQTPNSVSRYTKHPFPHQRPVAHNNRKRTPYRGRGRGSRTEFHICVLFLFEIFSGALSHHRVNRPDY